MLVDLVQVTTSDGIPLSGAYFEAKGNPAPGADVLIYFHGDSGNFYGSLLTQLGPMFSERGMAFLAANRRGHDMVATGMRGGDLKGYAFESVAESRLDYAAWLDLLRSRGHRRIAVGGHSGGAVRATYAQASEHYANVSAVVSVSPGEYNHEKVSALHGDDFLGPYRQAERDIAEGRPDTFLRPRSGPGAPCGLLAPTWTASTRTTATASAPTPPHQRAHAVRLWREGVRGRRRGGAARLRPGNADSARDRLLPRHRQGCSGRQPRLLRPRKRADGDYLPVSERNLSPIRSRSASMLT